MASRALMMRLTSASSSWAWSAKAFQTSLSDLPVDLDQAAERVGQQIRDRFAQRGDLDRLRLELLPPGEGEQAAHQLAALLGGALGHGEDLAAGRPPASARFSSRPSPPITAASRLLKSCAMPPVSLPIASIFCAWISWLSSERCSVTSVSVPANSTGRPSRPEQHRLVEEMAVAAVGALPAIFDRRAAGLRRASIAASTAIAVVGMKPIDPDVGCSRDFVSVKPVSASKSPLT